MKDRKQSSTAHPIQFYLVLSSDHVSPATGKTVTVNLSKDGGAFAAASGAVSEIGNGWYSLAGNATDRGTLGELVLRASASGCDDTPDKYVIVPWDPFDGNLSLTGLSGLTSPTAGALPTVGTGSGQVNPDGTGAVPIAFGTSLPTTPAANSVGEALFVADNLVGRIGVAQAGGASTITLDSGASATDGRYVGYTVYLYGGTGGGIRGVGQERTIVGYVGATKVATLAQAWGTIPDSASKFMLYVQPWANVGIWNGTVVATPATAGVPDVNAKSINNVPTTSVTTINANLGLVNAIQYDPNNLPKVDVEDFGGLAGTFSSGRAEVNAAKLAGQTVIATGSVTFPNATLASTTNIQSGVITNVTGAVGSVTGNVGGISGVTFPTNFGALGISSGGHISNVDTLTTYAGNTVQTGDAYARLGAPTGASISADIAAAKASIGSPQQVGAKYAVTLATADVTGNLPGNVLAINSDTTAASNLQKSAASMYQGSVTGSPSTTSFVDSSLPSGQTDNYKGRIIIFTSGILLRQPAAITGYNASTKALTFLALSAAPSTSDTYVLV